MSPAQIEQVLLVDLVADLLVGKAEWLRGDAGASTHSSSRGQRVGGVGGLWGGVDHAGRGGMKGRQERAIRTAQLCCPGVNA